MKYLIRDRDGKYPALFDTILADAGITDRAQRRPDTSGMNLIMEPWIQSR